MATSQRDLSAPKTWELSIGGKRSRFTDSQLHLPGYPLSSAWCCKCSEHRDGKVATNVVQYFAQFTFVPYISITCTCFDGNCVVSKRWSGTLRRKSPNPATVVARASAKKEPQAETTEVKFKHLGVLDMMYNVKILPCFPCSPQAMYRGGVAVGVIVVVVQVRVKVMPKSCLLLFPNVNAIQKVMPKSFLLVSPNASAAPLEP